MSTTTSNDRGFSSLFDVILRLRGPDGCPWDRRQTPESLRKYLLEESAELAEAIDRGTGSDVCEEMGDLFYILILLAIIHEERGDFTCQHVLDGIAEKMIRRHPHVFAGGRTGTERELRQQWRTIKNQEKNGKT